MVGFGQRSGLAAFAFVLVVLGAELGGHEVAA